MEQLTSPLYEYSFIKNVPSNNDTNNKVNENLNNANENFTGKEIEVWLLIFKFLLLPLNFHIMQYFCYTKIMDNPLTCSLVSMVQLHNTYCFSENFCTKKYFELSINEGWRYSD